MRTSHCIRGFFIGALCLLSGCGGGGDTTQTPASSPGSITTQVATLLVNQSAGTAALVVQRTGGSSGAATATYATTGGTAVAGTNFTTASGTLSWSDGDASSRTVNVTVAASPGFDGDKTFTFTLQSATGAALGSQASTLVTIHGAGATTAQPGTLALQSAAYSVGQAAGSVMVTVTRTGGTAGAASVSYATTAGTAVAATDFTASNGTLAWADGDAASKALSIPVLNTAPFSGSRTFSVTLTGAAGASLGTPATTVVTIAGSLPAAGAASVTVDKHITVDQFGYRTADPKVAVIRNPQVGYDSADKITPGSVYELRKSADGATVYSASLAAWNGGATQSSSGDQGWWFDFSSVTTAGSYFVYDVQRNRRSPVFEIGNSIYKPILKAAVRMFYLQRSGVAKPVQYAGNWADTAAYAGTDQDLNARDVTDESNSAKRRDVSGGWFDAGDTNKYVTFAASPVHQLLTAYQNNPASFTDDFDIPESGNGVPDLVDEVRFEMNWLKKMQFSDGSVALKVGVKSYGPISPPSSDTLARYYVPACTSSTIAAAGMYAHAAHVFGGIPALASDAADLKTRAINAWNQYQSVSSKQTNCDTGVVLSGDADWSVELQNGNAVVAAVYLYAITGDATYGNYVKANYNASYMRPYNDIGWSRYDPQQGEALLFYAALSTADSTTAAAIRSAKQADVNNNTSIYGTGSQDLYRAYLHDGQYHWGSNMVRANYGNTNVDAVRAGLGGTPGAASLTARAADVLHYFHGVNPLGTVYLTNMGSYGATFSMNTIFHGWFSAGSTRWGSVATSTYGPPPGYLPGGPNAFTSVTLAPPAGQPQQKSYRDWNGNPATGDGEASWEITEPGIYYQASYVKLLSAFVQ